MDNHQSRGTLLTEPIIRENVHFAYNADPNIHGLTDIHLEVMPASTGHRAQWIGQ
jgi:hypothetical protein